MPYLNTDDGMHDHPKVDALSDPAFRLWHAMLSYSAKHLTDGYVPLARTRRLTPSANDAVAMELVKAGIVHDLGEGCPNRDSVDARTCHEAGRSGHYLVHDYLQWNHSAAWWKDKRKKDAERLANWRAKQGETSKAKPRRHRPTA